MDFSETEVKYCQEQMAKFKFLVVDEQLGSVFSLKRALLHFGVTENRLKFARNLGVARIEIEQSPPQVIISEYILEDGFGASLRELHPKAIFILLTDESSPAAISHAAETDVGNFLFKPYRREKLQHLLYRCIIENAFPNPYEKKLELGKINFRNGIYETALQCFLEAKSLNGESANIYCHLAETIQEIGGRTSEVLPLYVEGYKRSENHLKSMLGIYNELLKDPSRSFEAYQVLKKIVLTVPDQPQRLFAVINLAIQTRQFHDIGTFYEIYRRMYQKSSSLENCISSALSVSGAHHLIAKRRLEAIEDFRKALSVTLSKTKFVNYVVQKLQAAGYPEDAEKFSQFLQSMNSEITDSAVKSA